jgi:hypothetical protein
MPSPISGRFAAARARAGAGSPGRLIQDCLTKPLRRLRNAETQEFDQSELFYTDAGKIPAQSHKCRAPTPEPLGGP